MIGKNVQHITDALFVHQPHPIFALVPYVAVDEAEIANVRAKFRPLREDAMESSVVILRVNAFVREVDRVEELLLTLVDEASRRGGDIGLRILIQKKGLKNLRI